MIKYQDIITLKIYKKFLPEQ